MADDAQAPAGIKEYLEGSGPPNPEFDQYIQNEILKEQAKEQKFGGHPARAILQSALGTATGGLSNEAIKGFTGESAEDLANYEKYNAPESTVGTAAGIIVPAVLSGGESLAAKAISVPVRAAEAAGAGASELVSKLVSGKLRNKTANQILKDTVDMGVQGGIYGGMNVANEHSLGNMELNGENLVAGVGSGILLGGLGGGAIGAAKAAAPLVAKTIEPITSKIAKSAKNLVDADVAASELIGISPKALNKEARFHPNFSEDLPDYLVNKLGLEVGQSTEQRILNNDKVKEAAGAQIGSLIDKMDASAAPELLPSRVQVAQRLERRLDDIAKEFEPVSGSSSAELSTIKNFKRDIDRLASRAAEDGTIQPLAIKEIDNLRKLYQKNKFNPMGAARDNFKANVSNQLRSELRNIIDETATNIASNSADKTLQSVANDLKAANKTYAMASTVEKYLPKKLNNAGIVNLVDLVKGGAVGAITHSGPLGALAVAASKFANSDARRTMTILADLKLQNNAITDAIKSGIKSMVDKAARPAKQLSLRSLVNSGFAVNYDTKSAPKSRKEAFNNVAANLQALNDQDLMVDRLAKSTARVASVAPQIAAEAQNTLVRSVQFLNSKLPMPVQQPTVFSRPYEPSSLEIAKFERYMQAVEHPLSVLEDVKNGTLTREHVEALQAVYPRIYEQMRQEALEVSVDPEADLSYNKKMQLGILLNVPTDPSLLPANIAGLQNNFMPQNDPMQVEAQQGAIRQGNQTGLQKMDVAKRNVTDVQAVQARKLT